MPISNEEGQMLMTTEQQLKQWVEHFTDLLNRPAPEEQPNISQAEVDLPISVEKPSKEEIKKAIRTLKNGKAARPGEIPAEALKADMRIIIEQSLEWNSPLYINFIDYEKTFDSVDRQTIWKLLRHHGVLVKIVNLIQCIYQDMGCRVVHAGQTSEKFQVKTGVRQGCLLSPFLFLLFIDWIMRETKRGKNIGIQWTLFEQLDDLHFADDLALLAHNQNQMQDKTRRLETFSAKQVLELI